ncbi:MAG: metal ABC transporter permease [Coriobacteriales bacterium]|jgi:zinc transport system permease protein
MLEYAFMQRSLVVGALLGIVVPLLGVTVVHRRLSMVGDALSHASLAGVAAGLVAGVSPVMGAAATCLAGALAVEAVRARFREQAELAVAVVLAAGIGAAGVLSGFVPNAASFGSFLFGSILTVTDQELALVVAVCAAALALCVVARRSLLLTCYDETQARVAGVRLPLVNGLFTVVLALTVAVASRTVGSLMVSSMMVVPVACALQLARSWRQTCVLSCAVGLAASLAGLTLSFYLGLKPGGTIVVLAVALLVLILAARQSARLARSLAGIARARRN